MAYKFEQQTTASRIEKEVQRLYEEISRTGKVKIGNNVFEVKSVTVFKDVGVVSGWTIAIEKLMGDYAYVLSDRGDLSYMRIRITKKPGIVVAVGEDFRDARAVIVYSTG